MQRRVAIAQINPVVGDFEGNLRKIETAYKRACQSGARLLLTPELGICGYPPHDLVERPEMFERTAQALQTLQAMTVGQPTTLIVGHIAPTPGGRGKPAQNLVSCLHDGKEVFRQAKSLLPTYDVFDESRYFEPAESVQLWDWDGLPVAVAICEDLWAEDPKLGRDLYGERNPIPKYQKLGAKLVISISASPYEWAKRERRETQHLAIAKRLGVPLLYVNQFGATDEILFDGASFVAGAHGEVIGRLPAFREGFAMVEWQDPAGDLQWVTSDPQIVPAEIALREDESPLEIERLRRALVTGIHDYFARSGSSKALLGLSGGIDSAVVAALAVQALGRENVLGIAMPSQFSSKHSLEDAEQLAAHLAIRFDVKPIKFMYSSVSREIGGGSELAPIALENLQARLRGLILMTLSNHLGALVLTTGNKSEVATGYCTLYGDMVGALAPIADVYKMRVYELARHLNAVMGNVIPERSITKPPSAELRPDQKDQDTLPPYELLDVLLEEYIEKRTSVVEIVQLMEERARASGHTHLGAGWVQAVLRRVENNEFKRRQAAPSLKVTSKAFGIGRRIPLSKVWQTT